jgi:hypothetical protein
VQSSSALHITYSRPWSSLRLHCRIKVDRNYDPFPSSLDSGRLRPRDNVSGCAIRICTELLLEHPLENEVDNKALTERAFELGHTPGAATCSAPDPSHCDQTCPESKIDAHDPAKRLCVCVCLCLCVCVCVCGRGGGGERERERMFVCVRVCARVRNDTT